MDFNDIWDMLLIYDANIFSDFNTWASGYQRQVFP